MPEVIRKVDFERREELSTKSLKEVGDVKFKKEVIDEESGETIETMEKVDDGKLANHLNKEVIDSGDTATRIEKKLKDLGVKNDQLKKRKGILDKFLSVLGKKPKADEYHKDQEAEIARQKRRRELEAAAAQVAYEEE